MIIVGFTQRAELLVVCLALGVGLSGFSKSGNGVNHLDIAPRYAGLIFAIGNEMATLAGIMSPYLTGVMTKHETQKEWRP